MTVPDMSLSVKELLLNHTRGIDAAITEYQENYFEEMEVKKFDDVTERHEYMQELKEQLKEKESDLQDVHEQIESLKKKEAILKAKAELYDSTPQGSQESPTEPK